MPINFGDFKQFAPKPVVETSDEGVTQDKTPENERDELPQLDIPDAVMLRRMSRSAAQTWLLVNRPRWPGAAITAILDQYQIVDTQEPSLARAPKYNTDKYRNHFCAVAWLCGASWGQLAGLYGVTRPTITRATETLLPSSVRRPARLATHIATPRELEIIHEKYYQLVDKLGERTREQPVAIVAFAIWNAMHSEEEL
jgi:hypothetical protein